MNRKNRNSRRRESGQSLVETAILTPLLFMILFNGINIAYCWFMVLTLSAAPRIGAQYSTQGGQALATTSVPSTGDVSNLVFDNLTGSIGATSSNAQVRVCSSSKGVNSSTHLALCDDFGTAVVSLNAPDADPEAPVFVLHRVDVAYEVQPLIPGTMFNVIPLGNYKFHRQVSMRSLF